MVVVVRTIGISPPFFSMQGTANHIVELTLQVVDMPLLFETGSHRLMWPRVFVTCSHETEASTATAKARLSIRLASETYYLSVVFRQFAAGLSTVLVTCASLQSHDARMRCGQAAHSRHTFRHCIVTSSRHVCHQNCCRVVRIMIGAQASFSC